MKSEIATWIIFPEDALEVWQSLILSGFSISYYRALWTVVHDNKGECQKDFHKLIHPGPYAGAAIERLVLIDSERIFAKIAEWGYKIKKMPSKQNLFMIYDPNRAHEYTNLFARHKKHVCLK